MKKVMKILMSTLLIMCTLLASISFAYAKDVYVRGYTRSNGTYVQPHYRTSPNSTRNDNYSTKGNVNPYTGKKGTVPRSPSYNQQKKYGRY